MGRQKCYGHQNYSSVDQRYLSLSPEMYKIYSTYTEKDFLNRAEELIRIICEAECGDSPSKAKNLFKATQKTLSEKLQKP
jgi:glucose-6-phosphate 1-dehydrogenase